MSNDSKKIKFRRKWSISRGSLAGRYTSYPMSKDKTSLVLLKNQFSALWQMSLEVHFGKDGAATA